MIYHGEACDADTMYVLKMLRCWVLCYEPTPPPPETTAELALRSAATFASQKVAAYERYVTLPDADLWKASQELAEVARPLTAAGWVDEIMTVQELIVASLRAYIPSAAQRVDYLIFFAEQRQNLIARLIDQHRLADAAALGPETVAGYTDYYNAMREVDRSEIVRLRLDPDLTALQRQLRDAGLTAEPVAALGLLIAGFRASAPPSAPADRLDFDFKFAEARQDLIARLIDDGRTSDARALVNETIDAYRQYASDEGAKRTLVVGDLIGLAQLLAAAQLAADSAAAQQAASDLASA